LLFDGKISYCVIAVMEAVDQVDREIRMGVFYVRTGPSQADLASKAVGPGNGSTTTFSWARLAVAVALLFGVLAACMYAGTRPEVGTPPKNPLEPLYTLLLHSFELLLGAVIGLLTGEAVHNQSS
jgi:hypothetical protein